MKWYRSFGVAVALLGCAFSASAQNQIKLLMLTPDYCPLICSDADLASQDSGRLASHLKAAFADIGYDLDIKFDRLSRSRVKVSLGQADIVLGPYPELSKNSKLNLVQAPVAGLEIGAISRADASIDITSIDDLINYHIVWNTTEQVSPQLATAFQKQQEAGLLKRLPSITFKQDATRMIGEGQADIMLGQVDDLYEAMEAYHTHGGTTDLMIHVVSDLPLYALHLALSKKSVVDEQQLAQLNQYFLDNPFKDKQ
ncbi:hypothetical protein [Maricurvus nonylphenolicus]|uniref:hypothetical protein n=1 Tax=Maricurvus nonylphenolicus TaxID=1008307 RepID=UPI0036F42D76